MRKVQVLLLALCIAVTFSSYATDASSNALSDNSRFTVAQGPPPSPTHAPDAKTVDKIKQLEKQLEHTKDPAEKKRIQAQLDELRRR